MGAGMNTVVCLPSQSVPHGTPIIKSSSSRHCATPLSTWGHGLQHLLSLLPSPLLLLPLPLLPLPAPAATAAAAPAAAAAAAAAADSYPLGGMQRALPTA